MLFLSILLEKQFQYLPEVTFVEKLVADKNTYVKYIHYYIADQLLKNVSIIKLT